ncbi:carboxymuconolactone decarboxylase family protein [Janibacter alittae]|uniref:Carboxymuconolactone decarboxylase family protein n=1 Tax=Janibacter alittae TaxID=3115209 RepID=A0ABZ2ME62_9MICO
MTARIPPGDLASLGPIRWGLSRAAGKVTGTQPPAIFTTLGRTKGLFTGWLHFAARLMPFGSLARRESEMVILTVATERQCEYEREHHRLLGSRAGLTGTEIEGILADEVVGSLSPRERVLRESAQVLVRTKDLDDEQWAALRRMTTKREAIELLLLVGHYDMLATTLTTLRMEPDQRR